MYRISIHTSNRQYTSTTQHSMLTSSNDSKWTSSSEISFYQLDNRWRFNQDVVVSKA